MLRLKKDTSPEVNPAVAPVVTDSNAAEGGIASQKKGLPPAALIGIAVGTLALAGLAAYLLTRPKAAPENTALVTSTTRVGMGGNAMGGNAATMPGGMRAPGMPGGASGMPGGMAARPGMPGTTAAAPGAMQPGTTMPSGGAMGAARPGTTAGVAPPVPVISAAPVRPGPGAPPTLAPPTAPYRPMMTPLTPTLKAQLDLLWQRGADAKHRGDFDAARLLWKQALSLRPGHPGFAEAIRKLPTLQGNRRR